MAMNTKFIFHIQQDAKERKRKLIWILNETGFEAWKFVPALYIPFPVRNFPSK
jgi:hypothetical protein